MLRKVVRGIGACIFFLCFLATPSSGAGPEDHLAPKWHPWFELGGYAGNESSRGELVLWAPLLQSSKSLLFADVRGKLFEDEQREGNTIGYRHMLLGGWNIGGSAGYNSRATALGSRFGQVALGAEALHPLWDIRVNGYLPTRSDRVVGRSSSTRESGWTTRWSPRPWRKRARQPPHPSTFKQRYCARHHRSHNDTHHNDLDRNDDPYHDARTLMSKVEAALRGLDAEVGAKLPLPATAWSHDLRFFVGGYYFDHDAAETAITGPRVRLEWRIDEPFGIWRGSRLTFESSYQWDEVRRDQIEVALTSASVRLGDPPRKRAIHRAQERRMTERLERDANIISQPKVKTSISTSTNSTSFDPVATTTTGTSQSTTTTREAVTDALTDVRFDRAIIVTNGQDLQAALTSAGSNSLIIAQGGATDFARIFLVASQTLIGGGTTIQVKGVTSGLLADITAPGSRPTILHTRPATGIVGGAAVVTLASNVHVAGVDIVGGGSTANLVTNNIGIFGPDGLNNVVVDGVTVRILEHRNCLWKQQHQRAGAEFGGARRGRRRINFQFGNTDILVSNNDVSNTRFDGIIFQGSNTNVRVISNRIGSIGDDAIGGMGPNQIEYSNNTFHSSIAENLLDIFLTNGNTYSGTGNVLATGLTVGNRLCEASPAPAFTGSISFTNGTVFVDNVAPCN